MSFGEWVETYYPSSAEKPVHDAWYAPGPWSWQQRGEAPYRQCSHCGCIHPEALAAAEWQSWEWATGKFASKLYVRIPPIGESGYGVQVKFYSQHLADPELPVEVRQTIERVVGLRFEFASGRMRIERIAG
jgi:hypothetical protein